MHLIIHFNTHSIIILMHIIILIKGMKLQIYIFNSVRLFVRDSGKNYCTGRHQTLRDYEVCVGKCPPRVKIDCLTVHVERTYDFQFFLRG